MYINGDIFMNKDQLDDLVGRLSKVYDNIVRLDICNEMESDLSTISDTMDLVVELINLRY